MKLLVAAVLGGLVGLVVGSTWAIIGEWLWPEELEQ